jgi:hypothetical protein
MPVPKTVSAALPPWASGPAASLLTVDGNYKAALRNPHAGYIYAYFEKNAFGSKKWKAWAVGDTGSIYPLPDPDFEIGPTLASLTCQRTGHMPALLHHIVIDQPHKCGATWLAFSPHHWSAKTRQRYAQDSDLRGRRMTRIEPAQLIASASPSGKNLTAGSPEAIAAILEYSPSFDASQLPFDTAAAPVSTAESGEFSQVSLELLSTRYAPDIRTNAAREAAGSLKRRSRMIDGSPHPGIVLALCPAASIALELNGYRNDAAGRVAQYGDRDRALQIDAWSAITGLQKAMMQHAAQVARYTSDYGIWPWTPDDSARHMKQVKTQYANDPARVQREADLCRRWELDGQQGIPTHVARQRQFYVGLDQAGWLRGQAQVDRQAAMYTTPTKSTGLTLVQQRELRSQQWETTASSDAARRWTEKYWPLINEPAMTYFKERWDAFLAAADTLIDARTATLVKWLQGADFLAALEDFDPAETADGVAFEDLIGHAIVGIDSSATGRAKIDEWVHQMSATAPHNLLWRALAQNQQDVAAEVATLLQAAYGAPVPLALAAWDAAANKVKWKKIASIAKKSLTFFNTNMKAFYDKTSGITAVQQTRGLDLILATTGYRILKPLTWTVDTVNEGLLQTFLAVRAGATYESSMNLVSAQIENQTLERDDLIRRLRNNEHYLNEAAKARQAELSAKWKALRDAADEVDKTKRSYNAARDARIAVVVALFEALNLYKTSQKLGHDPKDAKLRMDVVAASMGTTSAVLDVMSNFVKGLADAKDKAISYQALKLSGGALSVATSVYGAVVDFGSVVDALSVSKYRAATLFLARGLLQLSGAGLTLLIALSYCSPSIEAFGKRQALRWAGEAAGDTAKWLLARRAIWMLASLEITIFVEGVSLVISHYEPDALQKWCSLNAFGKERSGAKEAYRTADQQEKALQAAFMETQ